jgi:hypothetical protein
MSRAFDIAVNLFWFVLILACAGWLFVRAFKRSPERHVLVIKWIATAVALYLQFAIAVPELAKGGEGALFGLMVTLVFGIVMTIIWRGSITDAIANVFSSMYDGGGEPPEPKPFYSVALGKRKSNRPLEAIMEVRKQLAKFPNDYEGVVLLATIQAEDTKDLTGAEMTLSHFCDAEGAPPRQVAAALTLLADWHLKLAQDADSARGALEKINAKYPGTDMAVAAAQRIAHLDGTGKILLAAQDRRPLAVPEGVKSPGLRSTMTDLVPAEADPAKLAAEYVKHLEQHPFDTEAREKLAVIYANHYHRLDLAADELNQLADQPEQPPKRVAHWLNLLADLQIQSGADYETVRPTLEQLVERFPNLPAGELARSRLDHLRLEIKGHAPAQDKKLGTYEQNLGLKYKPPR